MIDVWSKRKDNGMRRIYLGKGHVLSNDHLMMLTKKGEMFDSMNKGRCPRSGEFVRIYLEAGIKPASVDLEVDI